MVTSLTDMILGTYIQACRRHGSGITQVVRPSRDAPVTIPILCGMPTDFLFSSRKVVSEPSHQWYGYTSNRDQWDSDLIPTSALTHNTFTVQFISHGVLSKIPISPLRSLRCRFETACFLCIQFGRAQANCYVTSVPTVPISHVSSMESEPITSLSVS